MGNLSMDLVDFQRLHDKLTRVTLVCWYQTYIGADAQIGWIASDHQNIHEKAVDAYQHDLMFNALVKRHSMMTMEAILEWHKEEEAKQ